MLNQASKHGIETLYNPHHRSKSWFENCEQKGLTHYKSSTSYHATSTRPETRADNFSKTYSSLSTNPKLLGSSSSSYHPTSFKGKRKPNLNNSTLSYSRPSTAAIMKSKRTNSSVCRRDDDQIYTKDEMLKLGSRPSTVQNTRYESTPNMLRGNIITPIPTSIDVAKTSFGVLPNQTDLNSKYYQDNYKSNATLDFYSMNLNKMSHSNLMKKDAFMRNEVKSADLSTNVYNTNNYESRYNLKSSLVYDIGPENEVQTAFLNKEFSKGDLKVELTDKEKEKYYYDNLNNKSQTQVNLNESISNKKHLNFTEPVESSTSKYHQSNANPLLTSSLTEWSQQPNPQSGNQNATVPLPNAIPTKNVPITEPVRATQQPQSLDMILMQSNDHRMKFKKVSSIQKKTFKLTLDPKAVEKTDEELAKEREIKNYFEVILKSYKPQIKLFKQSFKALVDESKKYNTFKSIDKYTSKYENVHVKHFKIILYEKYPPKMADRIIKFMEFRGPYDDKAWKEYVYNILEWPIEKIMQMCYFSLNTNEVGEIDSNDLKYLITSVYSKMNYALQLVVYKLIDFLNNKNNFKYGELKDRTLYEVKRAIKKDLDLRKNKKNYKVTAKSLIEGLLNKRLFNYGATDCIFEVNFEEFCMQIDWTDKDKAQVNLPSIWYDFIEILTGWKQEPDTTESEASDTWEFSHLDFKFDTVYKEYLDLIYSKKIDNEVKQTEYLKIMNNIAAHLNLWQSLTEAYLRIADKNKFIITIESIKQYFNEFTGLKNAGKFASQVFFRLLSPNNEPVNLFRFVYVIFKMSERPILCLWQAINLSRKDYVTVYDIEYFVDFFSWAPFMKHEFKNLYDKSIVSEEIEIGYKKFNMMITGHSRFINLVLLLFFGCTDWKGYCTHPDSVKKEVQVWQREYYGFVAPSAEDLYSYF